MARSRREFLAGSVGVMGAAMTGTAGAAGTRQTPSTPGAPPAFGTAAAVGPKVTAETIVEAEKLVQVEMSAAQVEEVAGNWQSSMAALFERRVGPRKVELGYEEIPATVWNPSLLAVNEKPGIGLPDWYAPGPRMLFKRGDPVPANDEDIAFATVVQLAEWIKDRKLTSERLTKIYIDRLKRYGPQLNCVITLCEGYAMNLALNADRAIAQGRYKGPLHGIPWGAKDLLDTADIYTTWGAEMFRKRVPEQNATVVQRLEDAGAVLVAKLSLGALALNDVWFGGQTKNPWNLDEGSSGSSAGPGAAVAAGLVGFAIGSETQGSIISPSMRCGVTGLRPTFGRVPRTGAMTLSWTCDKLGPMARSVEDTLLVLQAIEGPDFDSGLQQGDVACVKTLRVGTMAMPGERVGYVERWMTEAPATDVDRHAMGVLRKMGKQLVPVTLPDWPYDSLNAILFAESAAAFEKITLDGEVSQLTMQTPDAWPNTFRQSRFVSAVDYVQADRFRRKVARAMEAVFEKIDVLLVPSLRDEPMVIFNFTGHPSLTLRAGFVEVSEERSDWAPDPKRPLKKFAPARRVPHGVSLVGRLFDDATLCATGIELEEALGVSGERPKI